MPLASPIYAVFQATLFWTRGRNIIIILIHGSNEELEHFTGLLNNTQNKLGREPQTKNIWTQNRFKFK